MSLTSKQQQQQQGFTSGISPFKSPIRQVCLTLNAALVSAASWKMMAILTLSGYSLIPPYSNIPRPIGA
jgi:hypothetical protein